MYIKFDIELASLLQPPTLLNSSLLFGPLKLLALILWFYLCMYSVQRAERSKLVPYKYKPVANVISLFIGPFLLFILFVADRVRKIEEGTMEAGDIVKDFFNSIFQRIENIAEKRNQANPIELMDSSGKGFSEVYGKENSNAKSSQEIVRLTEDIILDAIDQRASDILIDPKSDGVYTIRYRIDGFLRTISQMEHDKCVSVVNSIKVISGMDIAERRRPQDGAFMAKTPQASIFFRAASAGVLGGEKLSIRVLNQNVGLLKLSDIGLSQKAYLNVADILKQSAGMVIVCGPTGSGKTTSLYAMLGNIDFQTRNVITVEDPVEYVLPDASQIEVNSKANITFANTLRSILRQDPDVICVGEIRDAETAAMALQASQTGHLVLATLHSSSNMAALIRLIDLGIKPLLLASALNVIISQRLVRRLCEHCKRPANLSDEHIRRFQKKGVNSQTIMNAVGCKHCNDTGYSGRIGIFDVIYLDEEIKAKLADDKLSIGDMKKQGDQQGRSVLSKEGRKKVLTGVTTLEEVKRVVSNL